MPASLWKRWAMPAAVALALVPLVASAIALIVRVGDDYLPSADQAWIELQVRDIGQRSVLLGPYSRFGWFHPGPILYYLLWLPYRITGSTSLSLCFAALVVERASRWSASPSSPSAGAGCRSCCSRCSSPDC